MTGWWIPNIIFGLLVLGGLILLVLPTKTLLRVDRVMGHWIYQHAPNEQVGLRRAGIFYKAFGAFLVAFLLCFCCGYYGITSGFIGIRGGLGDTRTDTYALWMLDVDTVGSSGRSSPAFYRIYPANTAQIYIVFYAKKNSGGQMTCRWLRNGQLQRQFTARYSNGDNKVALNDNPQQTIPVGYHEVYLEENGQVLAIVRFKVQ